MSVGKHGTYAKTKKYPKTYVYPRRKRSTTHDGTSTGKPKRKEGIAKRTRLRHDAHIDAWYMYAWTLDGR